MIATANGGNGKNGNGKSKKNGNGGNGKNRISDVGNGNGDSPSRGAAQPSPCAAEIELLVQQWESKKAAAKELYEAADVLESQITGALGIGGSLRLSDNRTARIVDNFRDAAGNPKVKHFGLAGVKLCELKVK